MNYTLNQLRIFHKVVKTRSITKAANELFMTQPAVSVQLKKFQDQFDIPLTEMKGRGIQITDFGMEIAQITEKALDQLLSLQYKTKEYKGIVAGKLRISSASTGKYVIPYFLAGFLEQHPGIDLTLDVKNKTQVVRALENKEIDFAVVSVLPDNVAVEEEILIDNKLYLVSKSAAMVETKPLIYREKGSATRLEMETYFKNKPSREMGRLELTSNEAVKQAIIAGMGSSILPLIGMKNELLDGELRIITTSDLPIITKWRIIWLKDKQLPPSAVAYLDFIRKTKEDILHNNFEWYLKYGK